MKDEKSKYILRWIQEISKIRPELGNFSICPYASGANFSIQEQKLSEIVPNSDFDVIINIVEDDIDANFLYEMLMTIIGTILTTNSLQITVKPIHTYKEYRQTTENTT